MKKKIVSFFFFMLLFLLPFSVNAADTITIYLFHQDSCPHCQAAMQYLTTYDEENEDVVLKTYELHDVQNNSLLEQVQELLGKSNYIPYIVIGAEHKVGFNQSTPLQIQNIVDTYRNDDKKYIDVVEGIYDGTLTKENFQKEDYEVEVDTTEDIPILGKIDPKNVSLPLVAVVIGLVDGFNPCAMWILIFLITMLLNMKDKKRMWILGISFLMTSAAVYLFFMTAWFNLMVSFSKVSIIQKLIGIFAVVFAFYNISNYLKERKREQGCLVVNNRKRKKIIEQIQRFTQEKSFIIALAGVVVLAVSVNLVELACSAGLPVLFTQILALNDVSTFASSIYMLIYIFFFMLDDLIVFTAAMITLKVTGFTTKYAKYSHLIGGIIMMLIGILLLFKPEWIMFNF